MATPTKPIQRITMLKVPKQEDQEALSAGYARVQSEATRDGKPYILSFSVGPAVEDVRTKGYTFVAHATFASQDDVTYYDNECQAHKNLKAELKGKVSEPPLVIHWEDALDKSGEFLQLQ